MTIWRGLFSFEGRLRRRDFWLFLIAAGVLVWAATPALRLAFVSPGDAPGSPSAFLLGTLEAVGVIGLVLMWPTLVVMVKRCHDRDRSGWWLLLLLIPVLGLLWWLVDLGLVEGTHGDNEFGASPKPLALGPATGLAALFASGRRTDPQIP